MRNHYRFFLARPTSEPQLNNSQEVPTPPQHHHSSPASLSSDKWLRLRRNNECLDLSVLRLR